ncbi:MAG TPA: glycosyltransferase [Candidatus Saccharimonadales bacterium]|nr:glycosyltransferase [Candidatus Saccharimonadales bacterium]
MKKIGIYNEYIDAKGGGEKVCLALAEALSKKYDVSIVSPKEVNLDELEEYFNLDLSKVKLDVISRRTLTAKIVDRLLLPGGLKALIKDYRYFKIIKQKNFDIFVNNTHQSNLPNPANKGIYMCMFPQRLEGEPTDNTIKKIYRFFIRMLYRVFLFKGRRHAIDTYDLITANSKYTQGYIKKYWNKKSEILYPICDSMKNSEKKQKIILNVGRFFGDRDLVHHKRQDFLLKSFIESDLHKLGWELHFAGSVEENAKALKYILD